MLAENANGIVLPETSLWYNLEVSARRYPGKTALDCFGRAIRYSDLHAEATGIAGWLQQQAGVRKGDRVLLYMQNCPQFIAAYYAILRADAVVVPVNPMNRADEFRHYVTDSGARVVICAEDAFESGITADVLEAGGIDHVLVARYSDALPDALPDDAGCRPPAWMTAQHELPAWAAGCASRWAEALAGNHVPAPHTAQAGDMAVMPYTSGTTGAPKGCIHTHLSVMQNAVGNSVWSACDAQSVVLSVLPLFHVSGMQHGMHTPIYCGATIVMLPRWDREAAGRLIAAHGITHWMGNPTMVIDLLASANLDQFNLASLRHVGGGGAAMPQAIADRLKQQFGLSYLEGYGLSETMAATHNNPHDRPKQQCLGLPAFNTEARIVDPETLEVLPAGAAGEIVVSGPQVFQGYWGKPDATRESFIELEGMTFFRTGDIGTVDEDGYYFITDRLKRMINVSGFKVWPTEVESLLYRHPDVQEACIIGARDAYRGETVKALVVLKPNASQTTPEALIEWARKNMAAYKYPRVVEFVEALPKSSTGKVMWRQLQDLENARSAQSGRP